MTRTERQVLRYIIRAEQTTSYDKAQGVRASIPTGKALQRLGLVTVQRFGRPGLRVWSTAEGREAVSGSLSSAPKVPPGDL